MIHVVLYEPEIPPNTGNVMRLCANTGARLSLIHPLGFKLDDKKLRRAGMDYREWADVKEYQNFDEFLATEKPANVYAFSRFATSNYAQVRYQAGDALVFGPETRGLPAAVLQTLPESNRVLIPMQQGSRSLNLSNSVAVAVYEAWRQMDFNWSEP
ncbi:MAG: tRNA (uridine(34)/cytosine(34)/5-carboxymethylaminomethyluridine(34)-2'-O)-methyltransferase TrmL [Cycloclasticus sp.]|nr:tRNA (uridine(34)/cytosine(34)/5-carboxymethylaminomethyluridine(34)-2'-O)-methyltransferase TrmL [Cycloclasticus sp.]MBQ0789254.1 tRNA (uridine(34)/cytosine(34)/5-carboxymethylaminomethyluridine(34)-2'-O)-methyltransferase TrmL [Cycloclasticus sp.]